VQRTVGLLVLASLGLLSQLPGEGAADALFSVPVPAVKQLPRGDAACAVLADRADRRERRRENTAANATMPSGSPSWSMRPETVRWRRWVAKRARVTGGYTGTTDQIFSWAACKWGVPSDLLRAVAMQESDWRQDKVGDDGQSFGIMQIKDHYADGSPAWGGYPSTLADTAVNVDFYAAYLRSCLDGDFYDGGRWLYRGDRAADLIRARGRDYVSWGCVGSWFSGDWYDAAARDYILGVQARLADRDWERLALPSPGAAGDR
jgi:autotransporter family porin